VQCAAFNSWRRERERVEMKGGGREVKDEMRGDERRGIRRERQRERAE
jgi:hypothetical protein